MSKTLFLFWHGLGDNILATPAIKKYKESTGNYVGWMMLERFKEAKLFENNPYIDQIHWSVDAWHVAGFDNIVEGSKIAINNAKEEAIKYGYDELVVVDHSSSRRHKIYRTAEEMEVNLEQNEIHTECYFEKDVSQWYKETNITLPDEFIFFSGNTGLERKNLDKSYIKKWKQENNIDIPVISPDWMWDIKKIPISFAADVMKKATHRILADSALYHVAHALDLDVDIAYFQRGHEVWNVVKPLHLNYEKVIYNA